MRIVCRECRSRARISSQNELSVDYTNLYCLCLECGHQSVMNLAYPPHTTRPGGKAVDQLLLDRLRNMPRSQQRELCAQLSCDLALSQERRLPGVPLKKHRSASFLAEHQMPVPDLGDHPAEAGQALHVLATATHKSFIDVCSKLIAMRSARHAS